MTFLSLLAALLLDQAWALRQRGDVHLWFARYAASVEARFDGGQYRHGVVGWTLVLAPLVAVAAALDQALHDVSPVLAWLWNVAVLYFTMGYCQFSRQVTGVLLALRAGDLAAARGLLGKWRGDTAADSDAAEIARVAIEQGLLASHREGFAAIAWFATLGPAGAVLYRAAAMLCDQWGVRDPGRAGAFGLFAARIFHWLDWVPARLTALTLAIVGNFEDAIYCWREQVAGWSGRAEDIILASGGGALGVVLGGPVRQSGSLQPRPELGMGEQADADILEGAVRLVWRSLVLWMFVILLVSLAYWLG